MIQGRPVRFLVTVLGGWVAMRMAMILPVSADMATPGPAFVDSMPVKGKLEWMFPRASVAEAALVPPGILIAAALPRRAPSVRPSPGSMEQASPIGESSTSDGNGWSRRTADAVLAVQLAFARGSRSPLALTQFTPGAGLSPAEGGLPDKGTVAAARQDRWSGGAWMLWRDDGGAPAYARGPRLGGSQAGVRVDYSLAPASPLRPALYGRLSSALHGVAAAELATGLAIRPSLRIPVTVAIERREALSAGGRNAFSVLAAGSLPPVDIGHGFRLDGYAQAGMVGFRQRDGFADGRLTVERLLVDAPSIALGAGMWGGTQPGVSRLDMGPQASLRLRIGTAAIRVGAEWRQQVVGNARPASGPALSIGTDF